MQCSAVPVAAIALGRAGLAGARLGANARRRVAAEGLWGNKAAAMMELYREALEARTRRAGARDVRRATLGAERCRVA